jgi:hypothetical protein
MIGLLVGGWGWLREAFSAAMGYVTRNPWPCAVIALCVALAWTWHGKSVAQHNLATCATARKADRQAYINAEAEASAKAIAALQAQEAHYTVKAKEADHAYQITLIAISLLAGCATKPLEVHPAQPLPAPKVAIPAFLLTCPALPSWITLTCADAPISHPMPLARDRGL